MEVSWGRDRWLWALLALGLAGRLVAVDAPLVDRQAWRQADTAAIARNFHQEGYNLFYPRVDWRGKTPGFVETNFPLFPYLVAGLYKVAGAPAEWLGRLLAGLFSTATALLLYLLARRFFADIWTARASAFLFLVFPLNLYFGRAIMPEALMLFLSVAALLSFDRWLQSERWGDFGVAAGCAALCFMVKIPTLYLGFPLVALAWSQWGWGFLRRPQLWLYLFAVLLPPLGWYWHAYGLFEETGLTFGIWNQSGYDKWERDLLFSVDFYRVMLLRFGDKIFTPLGFALLLYGVFKVWAPAERRLWMFYLWLAGLLMYLLAVPEGNHRLHYYQMPFVPVGAIFAGAGLVHLSRRWQNWYVPAAVLAGLVAYSGWAVIPYHRQPNNLENYYLSSHFVGTLLAQKLPEDALLVVGDLDANAGTPHRAQNPSMLYFAQRKGWQITPDQFSGAVLDSLAALGGTHFVTAVPFAKEGSGFWLHLLSRGLTMPSAYPKVWRDEKTYKKARAINRGLDRHFVVVRLR